MSVESNYTVSSSASGGGGGSDLLASNKNLSSEGNGAWGSPSYSPDGGLTNMTIEEYLQTLLGPQQV